RRASPSRPITRTRRSTSSCPKVGASRWCRRSPAPRRGSPARRTIGTATPNSGPGPIARRHHVSPVSAIPEGTHTITPHIVVRDAARAAEWYVAALGAEERDRLALPGGKLMYVGLWFGASAGGGAGGFPEAGILSPQSLGGTPAVLHLFTADVDGLWD